jgi:hypothetical protein
MTVMSDNDALSPNANFGNVTGRGCLPSSWATVRRIARLSKPGPSNPAREPFCTVVLFDAVVSYELLGYSST